MSPTSPCRQQPAHPDNTEAELSGPDNHPTSRSAHPFFLILLVGISLSLPPWGMTRWMG